MRMEIKKVQRFYNKAAGDAFCFDDCLCTFANYCGVDFRVACLDAMRSPFVVENGELRPNPISLYSDINEILGIQKEILSTSSNNELLNIVINKLKSGNVVLIGISGNCCPWDWRFGEMEIVGGHSFFLVGVDENQKQFTCVDPYYDIPSESLPYECFIKGVGRAEVYFCTGIKNWEEASIIRKIENEEKDWNKADEHFERMICDLEKIINQSLSEMGGDGKRSASYEDISVNGFYQLLEQISNNRIRFAWFLQYLNEKDIISSEEICEKFVDVSKMWNTLKKMFVKNLFRGKIDIQGFQEKIKEIIGLEKSGLEELIQMIHHEGGQSDLKENLTQSLENLHYETFDISKYYNNKGFSDGTDLTADFSGLGEWIDRNSIPMDEILSYNEIPLKIFTGSDGLDNIACKKQCLELPQKRYVKIGFLACTDWEECKDLFQLQYADGSIKQNLIDISEWVLDRTRKVENIAVSVKKNLKGKTDRFEKCNLYYYEIKCDPAKEMKAFILPNNENIHIMALTLSSES